MAYVRFCTVVLLLALMASSAHARQLLQGGFPPSPVLGAPPSPPPPGPILGGPPSPILGAPPSPPPPGPILGGPPSPIYGAPPSPAPSPSPKPSSPPAPPRSPNCYYGNSDVPLYCDSPPPTPSPDCFYGNSDKPLFCNSPPPRSPSPGPSPSPSPSPSPTPSPRPSPGPSPSPIPNAPPAPSSHGGIKPIFTTGRADYEVVVLTRPENDTLDKVPVLAADDFYVEKDVTIKAFSFDGLLPTFINADNARDYITSVNVLVYAIFPLSSNVARLNNTNDPGAGTDLVATRLNSPSDTPLFNYTTVVPNGAVTYELNSISDTIVTAPIAIQAVNILPLPNQQQTGSSAPTNFTGTAFQIYVDVNYPVTAGAHLYFVPQVGLNCNLDTPYAEDQCNFMWSSAPYPVAASNAGTPFPSDIEDFQSWITDPVIAPDWARIGADIISPTSAYNAAFTVWA